MAKAETKVVKILTLTLSDAETQFLYDVLSKISGSPERSRRGIADEIRATIAKSISYTESLPADLSGSIDCRS